VEDAQGAALQTGKADQDPAVQVRVVEPEATPLGHVIPVQVPPLAVIPQEPVPYCGGELMAAHVGALQTG